MHTIQVGSINNNGGKTKNRKNNKHTHTHIHIQSISITSIGFSRFLWFHRAFGVHWLTCIVQTRNVLFASNHNYYLLYAVATYRLLPYCPFTCYFVHIFHSLSLSVVRYFAFFIHRSSHFRHALYSKWNFFVSIVSTHQTRHKGGVVRWK